MRSKWGLGFRMVLVWIALVGVGSAAEAEKPPEFSLDRHAAKAWEKVRGGLNEIIGRRTLHPSLPDSAWFVTDKPSNRSRIDRLMEEALGHLGVTNLTEQRARYNAIERRIQRNEAEMAECAERRAFAPEATGAIRGMWATTRAEYDEKIEKLKAEVLMLREQQAGILDKMQAEFEAMGVKLTKPQMANLMLTVSSDSFIDLSSAFHNIKQLTGLLSKLVGENREYVRNAKKYYGMYVALVGVLSYAHQQAIEDIDQMYMPRIEQILAHTQATLERTKGLMVERHDEAKTLARLQQNLDAQKLFLKAGASYVRYLEQQKARFVAAKAAVDRHHEIAWNTYETVDIAASMLEVMHASVKDFATLESMRLPDMQPLQVERVREQFQIISDQLRDR